MRKQPCLALGQRPRPHVAVAGLQYVEDNERSRPSHGRVCNRRQSAHCPASLQLTEVGAAGTIWNNEFGVKSRVGEAGECCTDDCWEGPGKGKPVARQQLHFGPGASPGYAVVNLGARYQVTSRIGLLLQINNLFDSRYYTGAQLGTNAFTNTDAFVARPLPAVNGAFPLRHGTFVAPGAPFAFWIGTRVTL